MRKLKSIFIEKNNSPKKINECSTTTNNNTEIINYPSDEKELSQYNIIWNNNCETKYHSKNLFNCYDNIKLLPLCPPIEHNQNIWICDKIAFCSIYCYLEYLKTKVNFVIVSQRLGLLFCFLRENFIYDNNINEMDHSILYEYNENQKGLLKNFKQNCHIRLKNPIQEPVIRIPLIQYNKNKNKEAEQSFNEMMNRISKDLGKRKKQSNENSLYSITKKKKRENINFC